MWWRSDVPEKRLLTMADVAARLVISRRCLYDILAELNHRHPDTAWFRKVGRFRRFTEGDYRQLVEALKWRSSRSDRAPTTATRSATTRSPSAVAALRSARLRETKRMQAEMRKR